MPVWKNPCLLCGCGISCYWPNCPCDCHKGNSSNIVQWNNDAPAKKAEPAPEKKK